MELSSLRTLHAVWKAGADEESAMLLLEGLVRMFSFEAVCMCLDVLLTTSKMIYMHCRPITVHEVTCIPYTALFYHIIQNSLLHSEKL